MTRDAVGDRMGVILRFAVDELRGSEGLGKNREGREIVEMLAELPDLWDVNIAEWENDSQTSRFADEGFQESFIDFVKQVTSKPVVAVGRYTSADRMVSIGDCRGPATTAAAVYEGHRFARELGESVGVIPFRREITALSTEFDLP